MALFQKFLSRRLLKKLIPYFFIFTTLLIVIFNDAFGEQEGFEIFALLFFTAMSVWMIRWMVIQIKLILRLKKEKKQAELMHLKSQVNPHFFFNTLNNLYGLVEKDPEKAQQLILKLSDLMRYSIYEGQNNWVSLGEEITYLENYMDLHRMRYHKEIAIRFDVEVEDKDIEIMPLLFIIMVENAFKHGVEKLRRDAFVHIRLKASKKLIDFEIENNFDVDDINQNEGIGLKNLRKRLELVYLDKHELEITNSQSGIYKIRLSLRL
ncbi:LytS/YehU family sensor histidine kinase [Algoriphagus iocasae]|uniref:LytS/YehU family sensor histidine kinase n=1 Tax=Algoriphagus iocasae TaxID=1836499 RepID=A0A841MUV5_9BACT|nr:histidine kinase [Algoriphagus iocasae]MBB6325791.1 LytS/YehU family sensor histidine kinase [Algoriphagus iocasae]